MKTIKRRAPLTSGWQVVQNTRPINVHQDYHPLTQFGSPRVSLPVIVGTCRNEWLNRLNRPDINKSVAFGSGKSGHVASFSEICLFDTRCINVPKEQNILPVWRSRCNYSIIIVHSGFMVQQPSRVQPLPRSSMLLMWCPFRSFLRINLKISLLRAPRRTLSDAAASGLGHPWFFGTIGTKKIETF